MYRHNNGVFYGQLAVLPRLGTPDFRRVMQIYTGADERLVWNMLSACRRFHISRWLVELCLCAVCGKRSLAGELSPCA